jgi:putative hydrolase of the HAD superfamily
MAPLFGLDDGRNLMGRAWAAVRPAAEMLELARAARAKGMVLGLLSNSFGTDPFNPYSHCGVWDLFDVHVISQWEGVAKPDPAIYQCTVDRMQLPAEDCVFVDDSPVNLRPAEALGMTTIHATEQAETVRRPGRRRARIRSEKRHPLGRPPHHRGGITRQPGDPSRSQH